MLIKLFILFISSLIMIYEAEVVHIQVGFILDVLKMLKTEEVCVCWILMQHVL